MKKRAAIAVLLGAVSFAASAQLYRWTDDKDRVHITDTPPPPSAKKTEKMKPAAGAAAARAALNRRAVPFKEVQVWEEKSTEELKRVSGGNDVPTLVAGRSVQRGFEQEAYDTLLDAQAPTPTGPYAPKPPRTK